jgi:hypothetical protein
MMGRWPAWLQEGVAQHISGDTVQPVLRQQLKALADAGKLPKLSELGQNWSRLDSHGATLAYGLSLLAVEVFVREYSALGLRNLFKSGERLVSITGDLDRRLASVN